MDIKEKIGLIKYHRSSSLTRFIIDVEKMVSNSNGVINQNFRNKFANGCMVLTIRSILDDITLDKIDEIIFFLEMNFGIKYTFKI